LLNEPEEADMGNSSVKEKSILIVDDNEDLTRTIAALLRIEGFEVSTAYNGIQGYASYFRNPTEFVLTDIQMPEWNGFEMARAIRAINPGVKLVYVSGVVNRYRSEIDDNDQDFVGALFLEKPFNRDDLVGLLAQDFNALTNDGTKTWMKRAAENSDA
jgi:two-component system response regulator AtoC